MPNKLQAYAELAERTARQITGSHLAWTAFLTTAARLYKYPYNEQLMIYMQRPEATACAEYDFWNEKMGRYVRRGSTGIALIDASGYKPRLKYVFDVSDTGGKENARRVNLWELKDAHTDSVSAMLERNYSVSGKNGLAEQFESVASQLAAEYWRDHSRDILGIVADSYLEEYDDYNIEVAFKNAAAQVICASSSSDSRLRITEARCSRMRAAMRAQPGVADVHDLHIWSVAGDDASLTAHVVISDGGDVDVVRVALAAMLEARFEIHHATIQPETAPCADAASLHD